MKIQKDSILHFVCAWLGYFVMQNALYLFICMHEPLSHMFSAVMTMFMIYCKELYDIYVKGTKFSGKDIMYGLSGLLFGMFTTFFIDRLFY